MKNTLLILVFLIGFFGFSQKFEIVNKGETIAKFVELENDTIEKTWAWLAGDLSSSSPPSPTCNDGIQNGDETGIDCGGSCSPCAAPPTTNQSKKKKKYIPWW